MEHNPKKLVFVFNSKSNKHLDADVTKVKDIIKHNAEVVCGPICFKGQRQLIAYVKYNSTIEKLMKYKNHKTVEVNIIVH